MSLVLNKLSKACAFVIFADEKIEQIEIETAKTIFKKYHLDADSGEKLIKQYLNEFIDEGDTPNEEETDFDLGDLTLDGIDSFEVLKDLAHIMVADGQICFAEVEIVHMLTKAFGLDAIFASLAILDAVKHQDSLKISLE